MLRSCSNIRRSVASCPPTLQDIAASPKPGPGICALAAVILFSTAFPVAARDVSREQNAVEYARQAFRRAEAEHQADAAQAAHTRKALDALSKQFEEEQKKASASAKAMQQAKARLSKAEAALDQAWKQP